MARTKTLLRRTARLVVMVPVAALLCNPSPAWAQLLGTAKDFAVLGATPNVTNTGPTVVTGNVGVWPALSITGFPPGSIVPGSGFLHLGDAIAQQAQSDTTTAFTTLAGLPLSGTSGGTIAAALAGQTLVPGVYAPISGNFDLSGVLTLNGPGLYVFKTPALTTAGAGSITGTGASPCNIWWQVNSSATIGTGTPMQGNILALTSITIATGASLQGRALARNGTVTLDSNTITACSGGTAGPAPGFLVPGPAAIPPGPGGGGGVPTLPEWAMIVLAALLALVGFAAMRSRARA